MGQGWKPAKQGNRKKQQRISSPSGVVKSSAFRHPEVFDAMSRGSLTSGTFSISMT
ncbi:hypothetical protein JHJ32_00915 [Parapedobacter sp. ISTM3]|uniref:hypothetical protein n=1 Tax=Parapedobacter sp. ISTM3 TaxID=2800130 RepID=UPI00190643DB|nr:hypothetical protein [Parapedobacter sp. ISTM3]MBK1438534.1 hypothetical protein [Parapedobacter sp. ISTM3]